MNTTRYRVFAASVLTTSTGSRVLPLTANVVNHITTEKASIK